MTDATDRRKRWLDAWLHSDLVGIPVTLAVVLIVAVSVALYLVLGNVGGLFVGKTLFILALGGLFGLILLLNGRRGETTEGLPHVTIGAPRRVLVVANDGLPSNALCDEVSGHDRGPAQDAMIVVPVVASSRLHVLTDDIDAELRVAEERLDAAVERLRRSGIKATGHVDIGSPMQSLLDGLREFSATEVVMLRGHEHGWREAERFAEHVKTELGLPVFEIEANPTSTHAAA
jgi:nucleotide-binding universal stress UspA family protein